MVIVKIKIILNDYQFLYVSWKNAQSHLVKFSENIFFLRSYSFKTLNIAFLIVLTQAVLAIFFAFALLENLLQSKRDGENFRRFATGCKVESNIENTKNIIRPLHNIIIKVSLERINSYKVLNNYQIFLLNALILNK